MIVRTVDVIMVAALLGSAVWTFKVKNDSEQALARVAELERKIQHEREEIDILRADWSLLTSPDRLERLVERHAEELKLEPAQPEQFVRFPDIPMKPVVVPEPADADDREQASTPAIGGEDDITRIITGSVGEDTAGDDPREGN